MQRMGGHVTCCNPKANGLTRSLIIALCQRMMEENEETTKNLLRTTTQVMMMMMMMMMQNRESRVVSSPLQSCSLCCWVPTEYPDGIVCAAPALRLRVPCDCWIPSSSGMPALPG